MLTKFSLSLKARLMYSFGLLVLLMAVIATGSVWSNQKVQSQIHGLLSEEFTKYQIVAEIDSLTKRNARNTLELFIALPDQRADIRQRMGEIKKKLDGLFEALEPMLQDEQGRALYADVKGKRLAFVSAFSKAATALEEGDMVLANNAVHQEVLPAIDALGQPVQALLEHQQQLAQQRGSSIETALLQQNWLAGISGAAAVVLGVLAAAWVMRSVLVPLGQAIQAAEHIRRGDLTQRVEVSGNDELSQMLETLDQMREALAHVIYRIHESSGQVSAASSQIAAANMDLSTRTEREASALQETASTMEEINHSVQRNAAMTQTASEQAKNASHVARAVGEQVSELVQTMQGIHKSSQRIRDIVGVIDSIAFQTNILALNAAVEAARAGEHGRGFAVVASEVRSLAQHSANAAQEIKSIIEDNVLKMDTGNRVAQQAGESVSSVVSAITSVDDTVSDVAESTRSQSQSINQVSESIKGLDETTQQNAALVEETAAAATNLDEQVRRLTEAVNRFKVQH